MDNYFIVLNGKVVASCKIWSKANKLYSSYKTKVNTQSDVLQLWERGNGIIDEL